MEVTRNDNSTSLGTRSDSRVSGEERGQPGEGGRRWRGEEAAANVHFHSYGSLQRQQGTDEPLQDLDT